MARVLENISKSIIKEEGIPTPEFSVAKSPEEVKEQAAEFHNGIVLKALVPVGKRGKAGAIKFPTSADEAAKAAQELFGMVVKHFPVEEVLVEEKLDINKELYLSITIDKKEQLPVVIASTVGGIDIEELSNKHPDKICKVHVDPIIGLPDYKCREIWVDLGISGRLLRGLAAVMGRLYKVFVKYDCTILEINPLVLTGENETKAAACVMGVDDASIFRQKRLAQQVQMGSERTWRPMTDLEKQMVEVNEADPYRGTARYTEMEGGEVGFMCGGGGGSLLLFDTLVKLGAQPANYSEFGGNPTAEKVYGLAKGIMSKPGVKGLFVCGNITNNTQVDNVATGIVKAVTKMGKDPQKYPILVRFAGVNDEVGRKILEEAGIEYHGEDVTMSEAARLMVEKMKVFEGQ